MCIYYSFISIFHSNMSEFNQLIESAPREAQNSVSFVCRRPLSGTGSLPSHNADALPCLTGVSQDVALTVLAELFDPADLSASKLCPQPPRRLMCVCVKWLVTNSYSPAWLQGPLAAGGLLCGRSAPTSWQQAPHHEPRRFLGGPQ